MRKNLTKAISTTLAAAMVVTVGGFAGMTNTTGNSAKAADATATPTADATATATATADATATPAPTPATSYMAYTAFSMSGPWIYRSEWTNEKSGLTVKEFYDEKNSLWGKSKFDYTKNYIANNLTIAQEAAGTFKRGQARGDARIHSEATINDSAMTQNGEQSIEITNLDTSQYKNDGDAFYDVLHISTDIPMTMSNVKCTNVKVFVDDAQILTLAEAPANQEKTNDQGSGNHGFYDFMIIDNYASGHGVKGKALSPYSDESSKTVNKAIAVLPKKSLKITFTISGVDFVSPKKEVVVDNGPTVGSVFTDNGVKYKVTKRTKTDGSKGTVAVAGLTTKASSFTAPTSAKTTEGTTVLNYDVTGVAKNAFSKNTSIKTVTLGSHIKSIDEAAFYKCTKLTKVTYSKNITSIKNSTYKGCTSLKSFALSSSIKSIGEEAFKDCTALKSFKLTKNVKSVGYSAFAGCKKLTKFTFNTTVKSVAEAAFKNCTSLKTIKLGKKVKKINPSAFAGCKKLNKVTVYQKVKVSKNAFKGCKKTIKVSGKKAYVKYTKAQIKKAGYKKVK